MKAITRAALLAGFLALTLAPAAGAAPLAAALELRERLAGRRVALICSGGNVTPEQLLDVLAPAARPATAT